MEKSKTKMSKFIKFYKNPNTLEIQKYIKNKHKKKSPKNSNIPVECP